MMTFSSFTKVTAVSVLVVFPILTVNQQVAAAEKEASTQNVPPSEKELYLPERAIGGESRGTVALPD